MRKDGNNRLSKNDTIPVDGRGWGLKDFKDGNMETKKGIMAVSEKGQHSWNLYKGAMVFSEKRWEPSNN